MHETAYETGKPLDWGIGRTVRNNKTRHIGRNHDYIINFFISRH